MRFQFLFLPRSAAYGLEKGAEGGEENARFLRLVGERFDRRSAELRKAYAEELSLYRVLVTWVSPTVLST